MKRILAFVFAVIMLATTTAVALTTTSEDYIPSETTTTEEPVIELAAYELDFNNTNDKEELSQLITDCEERKVDAVSMATAARELPILHSDF